MEELKGYIFFEDTQVGFSCNDFKIQIIINDNALTNRFYQAYNRKNKIVFSGIVIDGVQQRWVEFFIKSMNLDLSFEVLCIIIGVVPQKEEYNNIKFESSYIDSFFKFRYFFIDEIVRKKDQTNLYKDKKIIEEKAFRINNKEYTAQYFVGDLITRGIGSSFKINGKLCISLVDKTIQEIHYICDILSRLIRFAVCYPINELPEANIISLYKDNSVVAHVYTNSIKKDFDRSFASAYLGLKYNSVSSKIYEIVSLLYNGIAGKENTLYIEHLKYKTAKNTPVERFMAQCRGFEYLFKRCEVDGIHKINYDEAKKLLNAKNNSDFMAQLLFIFTTYFKGKDLGGLKCSEERLLQIFNLRNEITHGDFCYSALPEPQNYVTHIMDDFLFAMNLKLIGLTAEEIEKVLKSRFEA